MKFLVDAQLSPLVAERLRDLGFDAVHVQDLELLGAADPVIWDRAVAQGYALVTKDRDFADWAILRQPATQVVWLRWGNQRNAALLAQLVRAWPQVIRTLEEGAQVVEIGR